MKKKIIYMPNSGKMDLVAFAEEIFSGYYRPMSKGGQYSETGAIIKLMDSCNHPSCQILNGPHPGNYQQWSTKTSLAELAEQWGWSRNKVSKFLYKLEKMGVIRLEPATNGTVIYLEFRE